MNKFIILLVCLFCLSLSVISAQLFNLFSFRVWISSVIIQFIAIFNIFSNKEPYSLFKIFFIFTLFFFGIAPLFQFYNNTQIWYSRPLAESEYFFTNILIIFIITLYLVMYRYFRFLRKHKREKINVIYPLSRNANKKKILLIALSSLSFLLTFYSNGFNIVPMLIRGGDLVQSSVQSSNNSDGQIQWLILANFVRPIAMMSFLYYVVNSIKIKIDFVFLLLLCLAIITCFPSSLSRYAVAGFYIPFCLVLFKYMRRINVFSISLILGLLVVFPFLSLFRNYSKETELKFSNTFDMFLTGDFDSYQNFALILSHDLITNGNQILGVVFFWVPRTLWNGKPIGSGAFIGEKLHFFFTNVSANYFAEGYLNFGFLGIFLFLLALAFFTAKIDSIYWNNNYESKNSYFKIIYMTILGLLFFILRGDLLSSFAYTLGFISSGHFVYKLANLNIKNK